MHGAVVHACPHQASAAAALHAVPAVAWVAMVLVTGLVTLAGKYLFFYARNRRARSIADLRQAAIEGKISAADAEKLIRADLKQVADGDDGGGDNGPGDDLDAAPALSAAARAILILRRAHFL